MRERIPILVIDDEKEFLELVEYNLRHRLDRKSTAIRFYSDNRCTMHNNLQNPEIHLEHRHAKQERTPWKKLKQPSQPGSIVIGSFDFLFGNKPDLSRPPFHPKLQFSLPRQVYQKCLELS